MKKIILTGGGTAGHVTPCIALMPKLKSEGYAIEYIGSKNGIERELITKLNIKFYPVSTGKLRRYPSIKNVTDSFRAVKGVADACAVLKKAKPCAVFSKGGFVGLPVVIAARILNIPSVVHESDYSVGLANKISMPFANFICVSFPETLNSAPKKKSALTGTPIRQELFEGSPADGLSFCGFTGTKPSVLIMGGSLGSVKINTAVRTSLPRLTERFNIAHICGKGNLDNSIDMEGYRQFEFVSGEMASLFAMADAVVSRAGANAVSEILALKKPALLIPLSKNSSRGDQILNAQSFAKQGFSKVLYEQELSPDSLAENISCLFKDSAGYISKMERDKRTDAVTGIIKIINGLSTGK